MVIYSYAHVFRIQRKVYDFGTWFGHPIRVRKGIPEVAMFYFLAWVATFGFLLPTIPLLGALVAVGPWWVHWMFVPCLLTSAMVSLEFDGRPAHDAIVDYARFLVRRIRQPRPRTRLVWKGRVHARWDESAGELKRWRVYGPATVTFYRPVRFRLGVLGRGRFVAVADSRGETVVRPVEDVLDVMRS